MAAATDLVTIADVASHLNWDATQQAKYATEMARFISATTAVVEDISGPVVQRAFDEWYSGGSSRLQLSNYPVASVTLVEESYGGDVLWTLTEQPVDQTGGDAYGYTIDKTHGMLVRRASHVAIPFAAGALNVHVQYTAGMCADTASVPPNIALAALELIRINWQPQQGGNRPQMGATDMPVADALRLGFFVPNRVMEILKPNANRFGIA
jgi:hypothetical protein